MAVVAAEMVPPTSPTLVEASPLMLRVSTLDPIAEASPVKIAVVEPNTELPL